jgi:hypothetical protein
MLSQINSTSRIRSSIGSLRISATSVSLMAKSLSPMRVTRYATGLRHPDCGPGSA